MSQQCYYCNEKWHVDVLDVYEDRTFTLDACCEGAEQEMMQLFNDSRNDMDQRKHFSKWFENQTGWYARSVCENESTQNFLLDYGLTIEPITQQLAKKFIRATHDFGTTPAGWKWGLSAYNANQLIGVAWCGRPVGRYTDGINRIEVSRLSVDRNLPAKGLAWNACSQLYGAAAKKAKKEGFDTIQTYITEEETGVTLKAAGWLRTGITKGGSRAGQRSRSRTDAAPTCPKFRYEKPLNKTYKQKLYTELGH